jgi:conjugal transfer pilus assembly protein TrbC
MLNKTVLISFMLWSVAALANMNDELSSYREQAKQQKLTIPSTVLNALSFNSLHNQLEQKSLTDALISRTAKDLTGKQKIKGIDGAVLFVSFSMPESLLFVLSDEAARFNIPMVINGLVDGDFKKTVATFKHLHQEAVKSHLNFQGLSIDPIWFTQYHISSVPALVVTHGSCQSEIICPDSSYDVIYGNANLKKSLQLIADKGSAAPGVAQKILERGHV